MISSLFAVLVPTAALFLGPPQLPAPNAAATVGVRITHDSLTAMNYSSSPRWLIFSSGPAHVTQALAPYSGIEWDCTEDCFWNVEVRVADTDGGVLHQSANVSLYGALQANDDAVWFGASPACWLEANGLLEPFFDGSSMMAPPPPCHVPVVRPSDQPHGDTPPPIDKRPLPPI